jgi:hypothetical protein
MLYFYLGVGTDSNGVKNALSSFCLCQSPNSQKTFDIASDRGNF